MLFKKSVKSLIKKEQQGIIRRYLNHQMLWEPHISQTKSFIQEALTNEKANSVAVLGSGWLLDIPMEFLLKKFSEIYLVDIVHPAQIRKKWAQQKVISFIEHDISGHFAHLQRAQTLKSIAEWPFSADVLISANLLSQLAELPIDYLDKNIPPQTLKQLQEQHLSLLKTARTAILISDIREITKREHQTTEKSLIYADISAMHPARKWIWSFETIESAKGETIKTEREVWAFKFSCATDQPGF